MSRLVDLQDAVVAGVSEIPGVAEAKPYAGQFSPDDNKRVSFRAPALFVGLAGSRDAEDPQTGELLLPMEVVVFVVAHQARRNERANVAADLAEAVAALAYRNRWGYEHCDRAGLPSLDNRFLTAFDRQGLALWTVRWHQSVAVGECAFDAEGVAPTEIYLGVSPLVGPGNEEHYTLVASES